nr:fused MFS/spermidine synthase [Allonocardiopsis opalescens]
MLIVNDTPQSHVDLDDPTRLEFEYVRRLAHAVDLAADDGAPIDAVHLGAGALTLARYIAATRPGSRQRAVEIDTELTELVRRRLPWDPRARIRVSGADAREWLTRQRAASADIVIADVFAGARTPAHLNSAEFVAEAARVLRDGGVYAANIADGRPLAHIRAQAATVGGVFAHVLVIGEPAVLRGRRFGNLVLVAAHDPLPVAELTRRTARDAMPARVLAGEELARFTSGVAPVHDAAATPSPAPPDGVFLR